MNIFEEESNRIYTMPKKTHTYSNGNQIETSA